MLVVVIHTRGMHVKMNTQLLKQTLDSAKMISVGIGGNGKGMGCQIVG